MRHGTRFVARMLVASVLGGYFAASAFAQGGAVRAEVDARKIGTDDVVTLSIVMEGDAASLDAGLPALKNLRVVGGPSSSTQISFVNGTISRQKTLSYALKAEKTGPAEIGPVSVQGHPPTAAIGIDVVQGSIRPAARPQDPFGADPFGGRDPLEELFGRARRRQPVNQGKLFVEAALSRTTVRVGEPVLVTYYVYTQLSLSGVEFAEAPRYPGFWAEEIERSRTESAGENMLVQGEAFLRYPVLERMLFPTKAGTLEIPEARLRLVPAGGTFGLSAPVERSTKVLRVRVDALPAGATDAGAVGTYEVASSVDRGSITLGDALTFRFTVKGRGNLKWIDAAPALAIPDIRMFPPRVSSDLKTTRQGIEGSKTWEFVLVPEKAGNYEIPSIPFSYFDSVAGTEKTARTAPLDIIVSPAAGSAAAETPRSPHGVSLRADLDAPQHDFSRAATALSLLALAAQMVRLRRSGAAPRRAGSNSAAVGVALRELREANLLEGTKERAASRIAQAVESAFGPRASWPNDDQGDLLRSLADDLEFLRFAPQLGSYDEKLREVRDRAIAIMESVS